MARRKTRSILPWLSAKSDGNDGRFVQLGNSFLLSKTVQQLSHGAFYTYVCMAMESAGKREFRFTRSTAAKYGIPSTSLRRYINELVNAGYIRRYSGKASMQPNWYAFTPDGWKN